MKTATVMVGVRLAKKAHLRLSHPPGRHQRRYFHFKSASQHHKFKVRDASQLCLNFRQGCAAQFQPQDGAAGGEHFLCQSPLVSQFSDLRADNVLRTFSLSCHAPKMELDSIESGALDCSSFGATCRNVTGKAFQIQHEAKMQISQISGVKTNISQP